MEKRSKFELFRQFPWKWAFWWVLLPNLAIMAMWPIGGPSMAAPIFICGIIALFASQIKSRMARATAIVGIFVYLIAVYVTKSFNVGLLNILAIDQYVAELSPARSPEYVVAGLVLILSLVLALRFGSKTKHFATRGEYIMAFAAVAVLVNVDTIATAGTRGSYKASAPAGTPIDSAMMQNGIDPDSVKASNLVVIIVESWGVPSNDFDKSVDDAIWDTSKLVSRYDVSRGASQYYGSTTNAEVREWCAVWADHLSFDFDNSVCLPKLFKKKGFKTSAFHSFNDEFFDRADWYPKLGFDEQYFEPELRKNGARFCDGVFPGACDFDVPEQLGRHLRASKSERNLIYWLTLNAHLPVAVDEQLGTADCRLGSAEWRDAYPMLCRSYQVHKLVADSIYSEIMADDFPESDILIVGDHMPPFFPRNIRTRFDAEHVPWIYLRNREALEPSRKGADEEAS